MKRVQSWVLDELREIAEPLIPHRQRFSNRQYQRRPGAGRKPLTARKVFEGVVYVLRTGIQWKALPKEVFGAPSATLRYFCEWLEAGFFEELWRRGLEEYNDPQGISWELGSLLKRSFVLMGTFLMSGPAKKKNRKKRIAPNIMQNAG